MNLIDLLENHTTEASCKLAFKSHRELLGVTCKKCSSKNQRWNDRKSFWHCRQCGFRTTLRSGTALQHTKMSFKAWFQVVAFMISTKKGFSAKEIQKQVKHKRYEPIWYMIHKIRTKMGQHVIYFEAFEHLLTDSIKGIRHRPGSSDLSIISKEIQVETLTFRIFNENLEPIKTHGIRLNVIKSKNEELEKLAPSKRKKIRKSFGVVKVKSDSNRRISARSSSQFAYKCLSNVKRVIYGIHHHVQCEYLQNYLDEFSYKFNRKNIKRDLYNELWQYLIAPKGYGCG